MHLKFVYLIERKYYTDVNSVTVNDFSIDGVDSYNNPGNIPEFSTSQTLHAFVKHYALLEGLDFFIFHTCLTV